MNTLMNFEPVQALTVGDTLQGTLSIRTTKPLKFKSLFVYFQGDESATVRVERTSSDSGVTHYHASTEKQSLFYTEIEAPKERMDVLLQRNNHKLPVGNYSIPFTVSLPSDLPASFVWGHEKMRLNGKEEKGEHFKIEYCLHARLVGSGFFSDYEATSVVQLKSKPVPLRNVPFTVSPEAHRISCCFLFPQGFVSVGAKLDSTQLIPNQSITLDLAVVNDSKTTIRKVRVGIKQRVKFHANGHKRSRKGYLVYEKRAVSQLFPKGDDVQCPRKKPGDRSQRAIALQKVQEQLATRGNHMLTVQLPAVPPFFAKSSYQGQLFQISHELVITLVTKALRNNPRIRIPLQINMFGDQEGNFSRNNFLHGPGFNTMIEPTEPDTDSAAMVAEAMDDPAFVEQQIQQWNQFHQQQRTQLPEATVEPIYEQQRTQVPLATVEPIYDLDNASTSPWPQTAVPVVVRYQ